MGILAYREKVAIRIPIVTYTLPVPVPIFGIFVFQFPWDGKPMGAELSQTVRDVKKLAIKASVLYRCQYCS